MPDAPKEYDTFYEHPKPKPMPEPKEEPMPTSLKASELDKGTDTEGYYAGG